MKEPPSDDVKMIDKIVIFTKGYNFIPLRANLSVDDFFNPTGFNHHCCRRA